MNTKLLGTALFAASSAMSGCGILETIDVPEFRFDSNSYIVQPGDTLTSVASRYKVDPDSLISINSLQLAELVPGQRLILLRDEEVMSMAAIANSRAKAAQDITVASNGVSVQAAGVGQTVVMPNATQTVNTADPAVIATDIVAKAPIAPTEEIIGVVNAGSAIASTDSLLDDDKPMFLPEPELISSTGEIKEMAAVNRPEGEETIIKSVNAGDALAMNDRIEIPSTGAVSLTDADAGTAVQRVTVNENRKGWNWPAIGMITREFDLREINRQGLDIDPGPGAGVQAAADGEVVYSGRDLASYGNLVILRHDNNYLSAYSKVSDIFVKENQKVMAGDLIAAVGGDQAGGTELHFEIRRNGEPVNPIDYLPAL